MQLAALNPILVLSLECGIVFLAFIVRGFSGFGAGLVMTPLLAFFLDLKHAVVISVILQLIGGSYLTMGAIKASNRAILRTVMLPSCLASLLGVYALAALNLRILLLILGIITLIFSVRMFLAPLKDYMNKLERRSFSLGAIIGLASGLLHGLYGAGGPPIVLFLSNEIPTKVTLRATLLIYFLILDILLVIVYLLIPALFASGPFIDLNVLKLGGILVLPTLAGAWVGYLLQKHISETGFRRCVAVILILTSGFLIQKGIIQ